MKAHPLQKNSAKSRSIRLNGITIVETLVSMVLILIVFRLSMQWMFQHQSRINEGAFIKSEIPYYDIFFSQAGHPSVTSMHLYSRDITLTSTLLRQRDSLFKAEFLISHKQKTDTVTLFITPGMR